jgi:hypothetical protein
LCRVVADEPDAGTPAAPDRSDATTSTVARILATTTVAALMAAVVMTLFGRKAGALALLLTATAHEMFDAPLARRLSNLGL